MWRHVFRTIVGVISLNLTMIVTQAWGADAPGSSREKGSDEARAPAQTPRQLMVEMRGHLNDLKALIEKEQAYTRQLEQWQVNHRQALAQLIDEVKKARQALPPPLSTTSVLYEFLHKHKRRLPQPPAAS